MAAEPIPPLVAALLRVMANPPPPAPVPLKDPATKFVLFERAKIAGMTEGEAACLATYLPRVDVVDICELVERGCELKIAVRIVL